MNADYERLFARSELTSQPHNHLDRHTDHGNVQACKEGREARDHLRELSLANNRLIILPREFENLSALTKLNLSLNNFNNGVPEVVSTLSRLEEFSFQFNRCDIDDDFPLVLTHITTLKELDLVGTGISHIQEEIGNLTNLKRLLLSSNRIETLPANIGKLIRLKRINLKLNNLTTLPKEISNLTNLELLILSVNKINNFPMELQI